MKRSLKIIIFLFLLNFLIHSRVCVYIITSNENATPRCTSISQGYTEYTFTEDFGDFMNAKDKHHIGFISFNVKCPNVYTHVHSPTVV